MIHLPNILIITKEKQARKTTNTKNGKTVSDRRGDLLENDN